jgi:hypothetical protein
MTVKEILNKAQMKMSTLQQQKFDQHSVGDQYSSINFTFSLDNTFFSVFSLHFSFQERQRWPSLFSVATTNELLGDN